jgi:hypothetical protein
MSLKRQSFVIEVEGLEDRNAPAAINPGFAAMIPSAAQAAPVVDARLTASGLVLVQFTDSTTQGNSGWSPAAFLRPTANLPAQLRPAGTVNANTLPPLGAGVTPLDNSIPNAAATLSAGAGLNSLSPFLPTYYIGYTQVGPFYTGSHNPMSPPPVVESPSLNPANEGPSPTANDRGADALPPSVDSMLAALAALSLEGH